MPVAGNEIPGENGGSLMACYVQRPSGRWGVVVRRRGINKSATFATRGAAVAWANIVERAILSGIPSNHFKLSTREFYFLHQRSKERAEAQGAGHHLSLDQLKEMYAKANGKCQVTGIPFSSYQPPGVTRRPWYPSIDRNDAKKPYTPENTRIVCAAVSLAMAQWGQPILDAIARVMVLGETGPVAIGPKEAPYRFSPTPRRSPTYRQLLRRKQRKTFWAESRSLQAAEE